MVAASCQAGNDEEYLGFCTEYVGVAYVHIYMEIQDWGFNSPGLCAALGTVAHLCYIDFPGRLQGMLGGKAWLAWSGVVRLCGAYRFGFSRWDFPFNKRD